MTGRFLSGDRPEGQAMELLTVLIPAGMLGLVLVLGRYEEWLLPRPKEAEPREHAGRAH
ncbi:hypothetical protein [Streptomyces sp. BH104]|uniref:hypothetical protein n=1 Tax=Streptomyces sp. BH104 TaxID=3410407 RepID=UPI003BB5E73C